MFIAGFDIGGTKCAALLANVDKDKIDIIAREQFKTEKNWQYVLDKLCGLLLKQMRENSLKSCNIKGIGISCGGPLDSNNGIILSPPNLPGWDNVPVCNYITEKTSIKTSLKNDADACAVAEWKFGAGRGVNNMVFITFGTGLGAGLILNGRLYSGSNGLAGEIGHIRMADRGPVGYGKTGSFEGFCSGGGIEKIAKNYVKKEIDKGNTPLLLNKAGSIDLISTKLVVELARSKDKLCLKIINKSAKILGKGLSIFIDILNPEKIIIGGVYMRSQDLFESAVRKIIDKETLTVSGNTCKIVPAQLGEQIGDYGAIAAFNGDF